MKMISLNDREWKEFKISSIFETIKDDSQVPTGAYIEKKYLEEGVTPRITVTSLNNGIDAFWNTDHKNKREFTNFISVNFLGDAFYHPYTATLDMKVHCLKLKDRELTPDLATFICCALKNNTKNSNYGNQLSSTDIIAKSVLLPMNSEQLPDYPFMEAYVNEQRCQLQNKYLTQLKKELKSLGKSQKLSSLADKEWKEFFVTEIFTPPKRGKRIISKNYIEGNMPVVSSAGGNNGVIAFAGNKDKVRIYSDCLSVANGGVSAGFAFYHPYEFIATDHVTHFKGKHLNKYHYLFIGTVIKKQMHEKYDFSREMSDPRLQREKLLLPINEATEEPDFDYMEQYMKNIMIAKYNDYLKAQTISIE